VIPKRLIRVVPEVTTAEVEGFWRHACGLHPSWQHVTLRDPIDRAAFPMTSPYWANCTAGAQLAGLVRLEALWHVGGIYLDSDVELYRALDELLVCEAFAGWEDANTVPDAVLGAEAHSPFIERCLQGALLALDEGPWASGPGAVTAASRGKADVLLLPPGSFYPYHYSERHRRHEDHRSPWTFGAHHWAASWLR
jgi:hypothetical protein